MQLPPVSRGFSRDRQLATRPPGAGLDLNICSAALGLILCYCFGRLLLEGQQNKSKPTQHHNAKQQHCLGRSLERAENSNKETQQRADRAADVEHDAMQASSAQQAGQQHGVPDEGAQHANGTGGEAEAEATAEHGMEVVFGLSADATMASSARTEGQQHAIVSGREATRPRRPRLGLLPPPPSVSEVRAQAFSSCFAVVSVIIGSELQVVGSGVFHRCCNIKSVTSRSGGNAGVFDSCSHVTNVIIAAGTGHKSMFSSCDHVITLGILATEVIAEAWLGCRSLLHLHIGSGVRSIGDSVGNSK